MRRRNKRGKVKGLRGRGKRKGKSETTIKREIKVMDIVCGQVLGILIKGRKSGGKEGGK